jgi:hypothetical protein
MYGVDSVEYLTVGIPRTEGANEIKGSPGDLMDPLANKSGEDAQVASACLLWVNMTFWTCLIAERDGFIVRLNTSSGI